METPAAEGAAADGGRVLPLKVSALSVQSGVLDGHKHPYTTQSAHPVDNDSWKQVGVMLVTSFNCAYILSFSNLIMVPLGWAWGVVCLLSIAAYTYYASWVLAGVHIIDGQRFIRYRDLMGCVFGRKMYYATWVLQFLTLILGNMGFILLGGRALKEINSDYSNSPLRLQVYIFISGLVYFAFSTFTPTISAMRNWLVASVVLTATYLVALLVILIKDGKANKARDYNVHGDVIEKVFNAFGAIAATLVANSPGLLPEIQSTLRKPAVKNMRKALSLQFTVGLLFYYGITLVGYWAYGSSVSEYLPKELTGPKWGRVLINSAAFVQSIISQHMFIVPVHEALDTNFLNLEESMSSKANIIRRLLLRAGVLGLNTLVTAAFPFMGDFVNLLGSFALFPLTLTFPSMIFIKVRRKNATRAMTTWHLFLIGISSVLAVVTTMSAVRLIINNTRTYHLFANS